MFDESPQKLIKIDDQKQKSAALETNTNLQQLVQAVVQTHPVSPVSEPAAFHIQTGAHSLSSTDSDMRGALANSITPVLESPPNILSEGKLPLLNVVDMQEQKREQEKN